MAVAVSDVHLSEKAPVFRSPEPCWLAAQQRQLGELQRLSQAHGGVPIILAGDVFHRWNPGPKLINFAIRHLPHVYAVPGQHDLRNHSLRDVSDTAYWTLVEAGKITHLHQGASRAAGKCVLWGVPWGIDIFDRPERPTLEGIHVAVIHKYVWTPQCKFPDAPEENRLKVLRKKLKRYDVAVFGDNHLGFTSHAENDCTVVNCGGFFRRHADQRHYRPFAGLIRGSGRVDRHYFDTSKDLCLPEGESPSDAIGAGFEEFLEELSSLQAQSTDFRESVYRACAARGASEGVMRHVRAAMGDS